MGAIDRWLGLDDERMRDARAPLWKRAAWHAVKKLLREHPGAVLGAAGAGAGYAVKQGVQEGAEAVGEKFSAVRDALTPDRDATPRAIGAAPPMIEGEVSPAAPQAVSHRVHEMTDAEKKELVDSLSAKDRRALADLAEKAR